MYSVNQVTQLYVVTKTNQATLDTVGYLSSQLGNEEFKYYKYLGAGGILATDRIKKCKVKWITYTDAVQMDRPLKVTKIALSGSPVAGQDYIINFSFRNYFGMSDEDTYEKHASARAFAGYSADDLYKRLAISLAKNLSREIDKPFKVQLGYSTNSFDDVTELTKPEDLTHSSYTGLVVTELEQPWQLGRYKFNRPNWTVHLVPIVSSGVEDYQWATITNSESATVLGNGKETADFEWFCMGERGDQYRGKDWPLSITTPASLLVNPAKKYNYLWVHFWDDIDNEGPQKSERDMVFITSTDDAANADLFALGSEIAEFAGLDGMKANGSAVSATKVAAPVVVRGTGNDKNKILSVSCATPGAAIYYTGPSGSAGTPSSGSTAYSASNMPLTLTGTNTDAKFIAIKSGMTDSDVVTSSYTS